MRFELPLGPSVNAMYKNAPGKGRVKSDIYKAWLTEAGWAVRHQQHHQSGNGGILGPVELCIQCAKSNAHRQDISNRIKAIEDLLVKHGVIEDDSLVQRVTAEWADVEGAVVTVEPA